MPPTAAARVFRSAAEDLLETERDGGVSVSGYDSLLAQPEFRGSTELAALSGLIGGSGRPFGGLMERRVHSESPEVWIGKEQDQEELHAFSVVASRYRFGRFSGVMGLIGPTRMRYERAVAALRYIGKIVAQRIGSLADG